MSARLFRRGSGLGLKPQAQELAFIDHVNLFLLCVDPHRHTVKLDARHDHHLLEREVSYVVTADARLILRRVRDRGPILVRLIGALKEAVAVLEQRVELTRHRTRFACRRVEQIVLSMVRSAWLRHILAFFPLDQDLADVRDERDRRELVRRLELHFELASRLQIHSNYLSAGSFIR